MVILGRNEEFGETGRPGVAGLKFLDFLLNFFLKKVEKTR